MVKNMQLSFEAISEASPGPKWEELYRRYWSTYKQWFLSRGGADGPSLTSARKALQRYMPELVSTFERLVELTGNDELAARFLSFYRPPPYLINCSQIALSSPGDSALVRNYDLEPSLNEGVILRSNWNGRKVIAASEFLWGVADGMNDAGLALSLAFGGRRTVGDGFGSPLILRYVLEVCESVAEAIAVLQRVPSHMAYNVTLLDGRGESATVQMGPDRLIKVIETPIATNHQGAIEWLEQARFTATVEREQELRKHLANDRTTSQSLIEAFLRAPLYSTNYQNGFGTLYTAVYRPALGEVEFHWPGAVWAQSFDCFREGHRLVRYSSAGAKVETDKGGVAGCSAQSTDTEFVSVLKHAFNPLEQAFEAADCPLPSGWSAVFEELEQTGRMPWEKFGAIWAAKSRGLPGCSL
jgi:predicted choloylglycine hydrolase